MGNDLALIQQSALSNEKFEQKKLIADGRNFFVKPNNAAYLSWLFFSVKHLWNISRRKAYVKKDMKTDCNLKIDFWKLRAL